MSRTEMLLLGTRGMLRRPFAVTPVMVWGLILLGGTALLAQPALLAGWTARWASRAGANG